LSNFFKGSVAKVGGPLSAARAIGRFLSERVNVFGRFVGTQPLRSVDRDVDVLNKGASFQQTIEPLDLVKSLLLW
jgi:hypothetical protein